MITMNDWKQNQIKQNSSVNGDGEEEDQSFFNNNALIEVNYDQFSWWYKEEFAKNMKSNRFFSNKFENKNLLQNIINEDWNERVPPSNGPKTNMTMQNDVTANGPKTNEAKSGLKKNKEPPKVVEPNIGVMKKPDFVKFLHDKKYIQFKQITEDLEKDDLIYRSNDQRELREDLYAVTFVSFVYLDDPREI